MKRRPWSLSGPILPILAGASLVAAPAHGAALVGLLPAALTLPTLTLPAQTPAFLPAPLPQQPCSRPVGMAAEPALRAAKTAALLGGAPSRLELILQQQASVAPAASVASIAPAAAACAAPAFSSAALAAAPLAAPQTALVATPMVRPAMPGEFLSSPRLAISRTVFDAQWSRVNRAALGNRAVQRIGLAARAETFDARLDAVNSWANAHIRYADDQALYGKPDYWADARETLRRGAGDCEDIAILKLQLLAALGVPRQDMFLTVARDLARHADHALLVVREGERFWLLDNATDRLVDAGTAQDYAPVFSFSQAGKWLHGTMARAAGAATIAAAATPTPTPAMDAQPLAPAKPASAAAGDMIVKPVLIARSHLTALPDLSAR